MRATEQVDGANHCLVEDADEEAALLGPLNKGRGVKRGQVVCVRRSVSPVVKGETVTNVTKGLQCRQK